MTSNAQGEAARKSALPEISIYGKIRKLKGTGAAVPIGSGILYMTDIIFLPALEDFLKGLKLINLGKDVEYLARSYRFLSDSAFF